MHFITYSGTSHHVTGGKENQMDSQEYGGKERLIVGNGNKLHISCIGINHLSTLDSKSLL